MSIFVIGIAQLVIAVTAVVIAFVTWFATVRGNRWKAARERALRWSVECGERVQVLTIKGARNSLSTCAEPPFSYQLRSYAHFQLKDDLDLLFDKSHLETHTWSQTYVDKSVVGAITSWLNLFTSQWRVIHGQILRDAELLGDEEIQEIASYCLLRIGMLQEQLYGLNLPKWFQLLGERYGRREPQHDRDNRRRENLKSVMRRDSSHRVWDDWVPD
jgi:hypothetical protein